MDIPVVLSHRTAWLLLHAPNRKAILAQASDYGIRETGLPAREVAKRVMRFLRDCGVQTNELETLDILVGMAYERTDAALFRPHVHGGVIRADDVIELVPGLVTVRPELCFIQAARWMTRWELIEFGYELCGCYEMSGTARGAAYTERAPVTTADRLRTYVHSHSRVRGSKIAASALVRVCDGARSPMEAALAMAIILPPKEGGLGYRGIELNYRIEVPEPYKGLTSSEYLMPDVYAPARNVGMEYDGDTHAERARRARDAERLAVFGAMGIRMHVLTRGQFAQQLAFHRAMNAIARDLRVSLDPSNEFQRVQNELRIFLTRRWETRVG